MANDKETIHEIYWHDFYKIFKDLERLATVTNNISMNDIDRYDELSVSFRAAQASSDFMHALSINGINYLNNILSMYINSLDDNDTHKESLMKILNHYQKKEDDDE